MIRLRSLLIASFIAAASLAGVSSAQAQQWVHCASEGGNCDLDGIGILRYGTGDKWLYLVATNAYHCAIQNMGGAHDPAPGAAKTCQRWEVIDEVTRNQSTAALQGQLNEAQRQVEALQEQQQYVADLEAEVVALRRELRRSGRSERRVRRREGETFGPVFQFGR